MFYQTCIEIRKTTTHNDKVYNQTELLFVNDTKSEDDVIRKYITPYLQDKQFFFMDRPISRTKDISFIRIFATTSESDTVIATYEEEYGGNCNYVLHCFEDKNFAKDVTMEIIEKAGGDLALESTESHFSGLSNILHKTIAEKSLKLFNDGHYDKAVLAACNEINTKLKDLYRRMRNEEHDGDKLFSKVFTDSEATLLKASDLNTEDGKNEQRGYQFLLKGMWAALRNPKGHANIKMSISTAFDQLVFCSMLMKKIDEAIIFTLNL